MRLVFSLSILLQLRQAFKKGIIKPGLNIQVQPEKIFANNVVSNIKMIPLTHKAELNSINQFSLAENEGETRRDDSGTAVD